MTAKACTTVQPQGDEPAQQGVDMPQDANVSSAKLPAHRVSQARAAADPVVAIEAAFLQAEAQGSLAQAVRKTVRSAAGCCGYQ